MIHKISQISTKTGDKGLSKNYSNESLAKDDILFELLGTFDELSSFLGLTFHYSKNDYIKTIQINLQKMNSVFATNPSSNLISKLNRIVESDITSLEEEAQIRLNRVPMQPKFVLPGSETSLIGAYFDVCRAICRRAERVLVHFSNSSSRTDLDLEKKYINRLSDYLFVFATNFVINKD